MNAALRTPDTRVKAFNPIGMNSVDHVSDGVIDSFPVRKIRGENLPRRALVRANLGRFINVREDDRQCVSFVLAHKRNCAPTGTPFSHVHNCLALQRVLAPIPPVLLLIGLRYVSANHDTVDLDNAGELVRSLERAKHLPQLVREDESRLLGDAKIAAEAERGMTVYAIHKHRNRHQEIAIGHLATVEDRTGR